MKLRFLSPLLIAALATTSCSKDKDKDSAGELPTRGSEAPLPDMAKTNDLWSLAPGGTVLGVVAAPGSAARLHSMMSNVLTTAEARPLGLKVLQKLREEAKAEPVDLLDAASIAKAGIDLSGGAALFMVGKKNGYMVLPVSDRAAFRKITEGTLETIEELEVDRLDDDLFCAPKNDRYLCASSVAALKGFGSKTDGALAKQVAALPATYRGEVEVAMDVIGMKKVDDDFDTDFGGQLSDPKLGIAALRFGNGAITARVWFQVKPLDKVVAASSVSNTLSKSIAETRPSGLISARVPVASLAADMPSDQEFAGLNMKTDVVGNLTGEFAAFAPQSDSMWGRIAVGLKKSAPFRTLLNMGCGMAPAAGIPGIKVTPSDGKCEALVDVSKLPLPDPAIAKFFSEPVSITAEVKEDRFELTIGKEAKVTKNSVSALGQELMNKSWNVSLWAEGLALASGPDIPWGNLPEATPETIEGIQLGVWLLAHVYEVGMAGAVREDGLHGVFHVATYAGDPPEAYAAYEAAVTKVLGSGGQQLEEFAAIKKKWPDSMAGHGGSSAGGIMLTGISGVLAAVAIPAFMKYAQRSREAQKSMEMPPPEKAQTLDPQMLVPEKK